MKVEVEKSNQKKKKVTIIERKQKRKGFWKKAQDNNYHNIELYGFCDIRCLCVCDCILYI